MALRSPEASARICQLAQPKKTHVLLTEKSLSAAPLLKPSVRTHFLATPKQEHPQYSPDRPVSCPVVRSALEAVASERLQVLATPRLRKPLFDGFDPYRVSSAALAAIASPRLQELSLPPARRCRTK
ncbi:sperm microtubule associated protein 2-like [Hoplias malabaricus]